LWKSFRRFKLEKNIFSLFFIEQCVHSHIPAFAFCAIVHYNKSGGVEIKFNQPWLFGRRSLFNEPERERASESAARNRANFNKSRVNNINRTAGRIFIKVSNLRTPSESACAPSVKNNAEYGGQKKYRIKGRQRRAERILYFSTPELARVVKIFTHQIKGTWFL
jgi:hypothetical protein